MKRSFATAVMADTSSPLLRLPRWLVLGLIGLTVAAASVAATCAWLLLRVSPGLGGELLLPTVMVSALVAVPLSAVITLLMTRRSGAAMAVQPAVGDDIRTRDAFVLAARHHLDAGLPPASICLIVVDPMPAAVGTPSSAATADLHRAVVNACRAALRPADLLADWQDDQWAAWLVGVDAHEAVAVAQRLQAMVQAVRLPHPRHGLRVSASIGVVCAGGGASTMDALLAQAEAAMQAARQSSHGGVRLVLPTAASKTTSSA